MGHIRRLIRYFLVVIAAAIIATVLLWLCFLIPNKRIEEHISEEKAFFTEWQPSEYLIPGVKSTYLNNYTDGVMLNISVCDAGTHSAINRAMSIYEYVGTTEFNAFVDYCRGDDTLSISTYSRYWTGYLILLRPLLCFFTYHEIIIINTVFQILLVIMIMILLLKSTISKYTPAFVTAFLLMMPLTWGMSLGYSLVINVLLIETILLLFLKNKGKQLDYGWFFLVVGIVTCFVDYLTFPLVTITYGVILALILDVPDSKKKAFTFSIDCGISWLFGYIAMWGMKWVFATIILGENVIREAAGFIIFRTSASDVQSNPVSRLEALCDNIRVITDPVSMIIIAIGILVIGFICLKKKSKRKNNDMLIIWGLLTIIPILWLLFKANHSYIHSWMTYKELTASILAILCGVIYYFTDEDRSI